MNWKEFLIWTVVCVVIGLMVLGLVWVAMGGESERVGTCEIVGII